MENFETREEHAKSRRRNESARIQPRLFWARAYTICHSCGLASSASVSVSARHRHGSGTAPARLRHGIGRRSSSFCTRISRTLWLPIVLSYLSIFHSMSHWSTHHLNPVTLHKYTPMLRDDIKGPLRHRAPPLPYLYATREPTMFLILELDPFFSFFCLFLFRLQIRSTNPARGLWTKSRSIGFAQRVALLCDLIFFSH